MFTTRNIEAAVAALPMAVEQVRTELQAGLAQFTETSRLDAARSLPAGGRASAWNGRGRLVGWSVRAGADDPASVNLRNGLDAAGDIIAVIDLAAGQSQTVSLAGAGVACPDGLYIETVTGALEGAVHLGTVD